MTSLKPNTGSFRLFAMLLLLSAIAYVELCLITLFFWTYVVLVAVGFLLAVILVALGFAGILIKKFVE